MVLLKSNLKLEVMSVKLKNQSLICSTMNDYCVGDQSDGDY
jgi:hypothetical protein